MPPGRPNETGLALSRSAFVTAAASLPRTVAAICRWMSSPALIRPASADGTPNWLPQAEAKATSSIWP
jgi:hypothetical protein